MPRKVLVVEDDPALSDAIREGLSDEGIQADVRPPQGMPDSLEGLQNYELVMLSNVPATALTQQQMEIARTWVQDLGGGFIMLGGEQSFGLGGYYKTTLEEILPVRSDFEKEKEKPSLAIVMVTLWGGVSSRFRGAALIAAYIGVATMFFVAGDA